MRTETLRTHVLPTDKSIMKYLLDGKTLVVNSVEFEYKRSDGGEDPQQLVLTSDELPAVGDWCISDDMLFYVAEIGHAGLIRNGKGVTCVLDGSRKVIAAFPGLYNILPLSMVDVLWLIQHWMPKTVEIEMDVICGWCGGKANGHVHTFDKPDIIRPKLSAEGCIILVKKSQMSSDIQTIVDVGAGKIAPNSTQAISAKDRLENQTQEATLQMDIPDDILDRAYKACPVVGATLDGVYRADSLEPVRNTYIAAILSERRINGNKIWTDDDMRAAFGFGYSGGEGQDLNFEEWLTNYKK